MDKRVAVIEKRGVVGGVCINSGTTPSKTLREATRIHIIGAEATELVYIGQAWRFGGENRIFRRYDLQLSDLGGVL